MKFLNEKYLIGGNIRTGNALVVISNIERNSPSLALKFALFSLQYQSNLICLQNIAARFVVLPAIKGAWNDSSACVAVLVCAHVFLLIIFFCWNRKHGSHNVAFFNDAFTMHNIFWWVLYGLRTSVTLLGQEWKQRTPKTFRVNQCCFFLTHETTTRERKKKRRQQY